MPSNGNHAISNTKYERRGDPEVHRIGHGSELTINFNYPKTNPERCIADIATTLHYIGAFRGVRQVQK